ncbi:phosphatase PAP2 family protein [Nitrospira sp. Kam-Ns4a]
MSGARRQLKVQGRRALLLAALALIVPIVAPARAGDSAPPPRVVELEDESITGGAKAVLEDARALATSPVRMDRYDALTLGGGLAVVGGLIAADNPIRRLVRRNSSPGSRDAFDGLDNALGPAALAGLNAGVVAVGLGVEEFGGTNKLKRTGLIGLEAEAFAVVAATALKFVTGRARPEANQGATHFRPFSGTGSSMASNHAAASFAVATVFAERYPGPVAWTAYTLATAVSFARIYRDQHWSSDVVAGALIGWGMGYFLSKRHEDDEGGWQLRPIAMERGLGGGVMLGKRF